MSTGVDAGPKRTWFRKSRGNLSATKVVNDVPIDLAESVDEDGSLVTLDPADWLVCFVPGLQRQWWHRFVDRKHKHVFAMRPVGAGNWLLVEPWWTRLMVTLLRPADAVKFLRWGGTGDILRVREAIPGKASQFRGWSNCAVLTALLLGRSSRTWTPHGLYQQLLSEDGTRRENVGQILLDQYTKIINQHSANALNAAAEFSSLRLTDILFMIARNLLERTMTPCLLEVCYAAICQTSRYPDVTQIYIQDGPESAIAVLTKVLAKARQAGEITLVDCESGARQFLGMLYGYIHLAAVLQLSEIPTRSEINLRARTAVEAFMDGIHPARRSIAATSESLVHATGCH